MKRNVILRINNEEYTVLTKTNRTLLEVLREDLHLTGTKEGCGEGVCGSCTVLLDGRPVRSCLLLVTEAEGREIKTIEGLAKEGRLDPIQEAFIEHHAIQCGFCSPGMILTGYALLKENPRATEEEIRFAISGNICRCTGYVKIVEAIRSLSTSEGRR
ncbi:MAG: (2Fe-2S)-binding protein [Syntrophorhabdaceae bacterium]|nr:(2Fe-2S)-binding protein [Syntrophorhabdaceae bacterium]